MQEKKHSLGFNCSLSEQLITESRGIIHLYSLQK